MGVLSEMVSYPKPMNTSSGWLCLGLGLHEWSGDDGLRKRIGRVAECSA